MSVTRYSQKMAAKARNSPVMEINPNGLWVHINDYEALQLVAGLNHDTVIAQQAVYNEHIDKLEKQLKGLGHGK